MSYQGYGQPYGQPPPQGGYGQYPPSHSPYPPQGHYPPPQQQGGYYQQQPPPPQPQGQYPPPHAGSPYPPQGGYGQPPPPHYGGAPPPGQYGAPPPVPPNHPYGGGGHSPAPPPNQYGAPPPQQPYGGAPAPPTPPTLGYGPSQTIQWNGDADAQGLRSAMKGFGTDEKALIRILSNKDPLQIDMIRNSFNKQFRRDLVSDIKSETSSWFEKGLVELARGPLMTDCFRLYEAMDGPGTKESVLNDVLLSRSNADMQAIKNAYRHTFRRSLEDAVKGDLSMKTERHFMMVLAAQRAEDSAPVVPQQVDDDVMKLYQATEGRMGTDEILVCSIFSNRNDNQLRAINHTYQQKFRRDLETVIKGEFSGHMQDALLFQLRHAIDKYMHAATLLEDAMIGMGTKDHLLVSRVVRFHWDRNELANIKGAYKQKYRQSLSHRIKGETSGDYERLMVACVGD